MGCHYNIELTSDNGDPIEVSAENVAEIGLTENDIVLIKGEKGDKGDPGENGADGQPGKQGADGLSAYQIAVDNGFTGTEAEWLASLKGEAGPQGPKGNTGSTGATGPKGDKGDKGEKGMTGPQGPQGIQGEKGDSYTLTDEDMKTIADKVEIPDNIMTYSAKNSGVNVRGVSSKTTTYGDGVLVASQGLVMSGTAQNAGLVTRGICGVTTPDAKGSCSKEHLYINYDGDSAYSRKVVLGAGTPGSAISKTTAKDSYGYGNQYTAVRGDQMVNFVTDKVADAKYDDTALKNRVTTLEGKTDADTTYTFSADKVTASDGTEQEVTVTKVNGHAVKADVPENAVFTDTVTNVISDNIASYPDDTTSAASPYAIFMWADSKAFPVTITKSQMDYALSNMGMATPLTYTYAKNFMANVGTMINDKYNCVNVLAMAEIINALCQQIDSNTNGISAKQDALTFDSEPTADSTNPVTSGGIKAYVDALFADYNKNRNLR